MIIAKISSKFQICIPKELRVKLQIKPGQLFIFIAKGSCLELVPKRNIKDLRGVMSSANTENIRDRSERS